MPRASQVFWRVINPNAGEAQIQSSVIFGLTAALFGRISVEGGAVQQGNFPDYEMLRLGTAPRQTVEFMKSDEVPGGLGEPGTPPGTPAFTNVLFAATGERVRKLPVTDLGYKVIPS